MNSTQALIEGAMEDFRAGRLAEAERACREVLARDPRHALALNVLGVVTHVQGDADGGIALLRRSLEIEPAAAPAHNNLAVILLAQGEIAAAVAHFRRATELSPRYVAALVNLGHALAHAGDPNASAEAFERAIAADPNGWEAYSALGQIYAGAGELARAIELQRHAIERSPQNAVAVDRLGGAFLYCGEIDEAIAQFREAMNLRPDWAQPHDNLLLAMNYLPALSGHELFAEHRQWGERRADPLLSTVRAHENDRDPKRRIRIGYVSPDFRQHALVFFIEPMLANHLKNNVEVFCYSASPTTDAVTDRLRGYADTWRDISSLDDERAAEVMRRDRIDVLVDLAGHTGNNRLLTLARKPAPVQVTWLGYPNTTGMKAIDCWLTDAHLHPPHESETFGTEQVVRLSNTFACYRPPGSSPEVVDPPALRRGFITFGSFNNVAKLNDSVVELWAKVLGQLPNARLVLMSSELRNARMRERLAARFQASGISPDRLEFLAALPMSDYLRVYERVDVALDPFPFTGHTVTMHTLWMGVPIVTLAGRTHVSRRGVSILTNLGLSELIANSPEEYVELAGALARDGERLVEMRRTMRKRMRASALMDEVGFTRELEAAYREMWERWCAGSGAAQAAPAG